MGTFYNRQSQTERRRALRNNATRSEQILWVYLKESQLREKFRRQFGVGPYILDFYCRRIRLAIEIDGDSHFTNDAEQYDKDREIFINSNEIKTLRFTNIEVIENITAVIESILEEINLRSQQFKTTPLSPPCEGGEEHNMPQIIPAFLVESEKEFEQKLRLVENNCMLIQVDVLDGTLFPNVSWFDPVAISQFNTSVEMELHLMVENPLPIIKEWKKLVPMFTRAIVSAEMHRPDGVVVSYIKDVLGLQVGIAINPETPLKEIEDVLHLIDQLTIMGVHPGKSGQSFDGDYLFDKIKQARHHRPNLTIEFDGGVTEELIPKLIAAGVNRLVCGSLIFNNQNPTQKLIELNIACHPEGV